jgi:peptide/nickel transport system permease protein
MPLATHQFTKSTLLVDGKPVRDYPRLRSAGVHLQDPQQQWLGDVLRRLGAGLIGGLALGLFAVFLLLLRLARRHGGLGHAAHVLLTARTDTPWRAISLTVVLACMLIGAVASLASGYHVFGTDRTGNDVLWQALKSVRTVLIIGSLTSLAMLPPALFFGIAAGYYKGKIDDAIQYLYITLTTIPGILLVAAFSLMMQVYIDNHLDLFDTAAARADLRLFLLCMILGLTGWAGLCRLLRAETLKLRELEYVQAARAFGVSHCGALCGGTYCPIWRIWCSLPWC